MNLFTLLLEIQLITMSGALAPGPLSIATIAIGNRSGWKGGLNVAIGHSIFEFPLYLLIGYGIINLSIIGGIQWLLSILGGIALLYFSFLLYKSKEFNINYTSHEKYVFKNAFSAGFLLTALNPYFIIWWLTVGAKLILDIIDTVGTSLMVLMYISHVWMDYVWLIFLSILSFSAVRKLSNKIFRIIQYLLLLLMIYFAMYFIIDGLLHLYSLL